MYCLTRTENTSDLMMAYYFVSANIRKKELTFSKDKENAYLFKNLIDCQITCNELNKWVSTNPLVVTPC